MALVLCLGCVPIGDQAYDIDVVVTLDATALAEFNETERGVVMLTTIGTDYDRARALGVVCNAGNDQLSYHETLGLGTQCPGAITVMAWIEPVTPDNADGFACDGVVEDLSPAEALPPTGAASAEADTPEDCHHVELELDLHR